MPKRTIATCGPDNRADASFAKKAMKPKSVADAVMSSSARFFGEVLILSGQFACAVRSSTSIRIHICVLPAAH